MCIYAHNFFIYIDRINYVRKLYSNIIRKLFEAFLASITSVSEAIYGDSKIEDYFVNKYI